MIDHAHTSSAEARPIAPVPRLLLTTAQAAKSLEICERTLWDRTKSGEIRCVKIGRLVRYAPGDLSDWIETLKK